MTGNRDAADNDAKQKVAFSLGKKKKTKKTVATPVPEFGEEEREKRKNERRRTSPLVIPLPASSTAAGRGGYLTGRLTTAKLNDERKQEDQEGDDKSKKSNAPYNDEDAAAAEALMQSATDHFSNKQKDTGASTNFSAQGSLVISGAENTAHQQQSEAEAQQLRRDLETRPDDLPVDSDVYEQTPISEFGAAMLRGMGWTGSDNASKTAEETESMPRPHRLGLGATPKLPPTSNTISGKSKMRRPDQVARDERLLKQHQEYETERQKRLEKDKQRTLQDGSIVELADGKRAEMVKLMGVPGLNRVMVLCEGETDAVTIKRGDVVGLVDRQKLDEKPFRGAYVSRSSSKSIRDEGDRPRDQEGAERRIKEKLRSLEDERHHGRDTGRVRFRDSDKDRDRYRDDNRDRRKKRRSKEDSREVKKRRRKEEPEHWLLTNIRVRVVTEKLGRRHYKQKGVVLDVTDGGGKATLQMAEGQVLDRVAERYLETALPKIGGNAVVLAGKHKFAKGRLLERDSKAGRGIIQVFEDMNVLTLSLDDLAEWCGPLDDTMG
jgi:hypothetical protein